MRVAGKPKLAMPNSLTHLLIDIYAAAGGILSARLLCFIEEVTV